MGSIEILDRQRGTDPFNRVSNYGVDEAVERVVWLPFVVRVVVVFLASDHFLLLHLDTGEERTGHSTSSILPN